MEWTCVKCGQTSFAEASPGDGICSNCTRAAATFELKDAIRWSRLLRAKETRRAVNRLLESEAASRGQLAAREA